MKFGFRLNADDKYHVIIQKLSALSELDADQILLAEIFAALIRVKLK